MELQEIIESINVNEITPARQLELDVLVKYIQSKSEQGNVSRLKFICTHNSRRSQLAQVWAMVAAEENGVAIESYSGGVEVTACNARTVENLKRFGFDLELREQVENPRYLLSYKGNSLNLFSKLFDDAENPKDDFAAVMTCDHADENCPLVPGCDQRISLRYADPKAMDDQPLESIFYDYRSAEIATEMFYVFSKIK